MTTYAQYLAQAESDIASGKRKQTPLTEYIWNEIKDKDSLAPPSFSIEDLSLVKHNERKASRR